MKAWSVTSSSRQSGPSQPLPMLTPMLLLLQICGPMPIKARRLGPIPVACSQSRPLAWRRGGVVSPLCCHGMRNFKNQWQTAYR